MGVSANAGDALIQDHTGVRDTLPSVLFPILLLCINAAFAEETTLEFGSAGTPVETRGTNGASEHSNMRCSYIQPTKPVSVILMMISEGKQIEIN